MSENIDCNLSIGVTEAGKIGEDIIIGVLSIDKDDEVRLLVKNILHANHIVNLAGAKPPDPTAAKPFCQRYIANMIRDRSLKIALFRIQPKEQFKLMQQISVLEGQRLFELGKSLDTTNCQYVAKALQLRYQYPKLFVDTFVKSILQYYGLNWFLKEKSCGHADLFKDNIMNEHRMALHIIVNGGAQFSSYQDLLNDNLKNFWSDIKTNEGSKFYWNLMIATHGIANADTWYPVVSGINYITQHLNNNLDDFLFADATLQDVTADELQAQTDHVGKSLLQVLHDLYLERTGSTFRPPKLWRIGTFDNLGEYDLSLPYLMLKRSIQEKRITAREVDDDVKSIERFYQYNNPLERDAFLVGKVTNNEQEYIEILKEHGIIGKTILDDELLSEYRKMLANISEFVQSDTCIITNEDQRKVLERIAVIEKTDFKQIEKLSIPAIV